MQTKKQLEKQERKLGSKIAGAYKKHSIKHLHDATRQYLNSHAVKALACKKTRKKGDKIAPQKLALQLNVWEPSNEVVILHPVLKTNSYDYRMLLKFGQENRARQMMLKMALMHRFKTQPEQFMMNGGRDKAIQKLVANYKEGFQYVLELDVYRCFNSFDVLGVSKHLALPKEVCRNVLSGINLNISLSRCYEKIIDYSPTEFEGLTSLQVLAHMDSDWEPARQGLTEGSLVSPFVCELLLAWVVERLPKSKGRLINFADNFLFMCESENEVMELHNILQELLFKHPAGPLKVKPYKTVFKPGQPFEFLGYWIEPYGGEASVRWPERADKKSRKQRGRVYNLLLSSVSLERKANAINNLFKRQRNLISGYQEWQNGKNYFRTKMTNLVLEAKSHGVTDQMLVKELKALIK